MSGTKRESLERSDDELLARWRAGDLEAGELLFRRYYLPVERFFVNKVRRGVADLIQETFLACVEGRDRVRERTRFRQYLFAVAYNTFCKHLRERYRRTHTTDLEQLVLRDLSPSPSSVLVHCGEQRLLLEGLRAISMRYQVVLELHYWEQLTTGDIAEILDVSPGTIKSRLIRGRAALEAAMSRLAHSASELNSTVTKLDDWAEQCRLGLSTGGADER